MYVCMYVCTYVSVDRRDYMMVWIPDKNHGWCAAQVIHYDKESQQFDVEALNESVYYTNSIRQTFHHSKIHPIDPSHMYDLDNMCLMNNMHEAPLLDLLRRRFYLDKMYTLSGNILISLNPYKVIDGLYDNLFTYVDLENKSSLIGNSAIQSTHPHVFSIANQALSALVNHATTDDISSATNHPFSNHSIVISGESGAGKTENSKHVINFLIHANSAMDRSAPRSGVMKSTKVIPNSKVAISSGVSDSIGSDICDDIDVVSKTDSAISSIASLKSILVTSSIVLEAFGNAKTVRNDNSSRFGKYIKLIYRKPTSFVEEGKESSNDRTSSTSHSRIDRPSLVSSITETFLLEKSRLVSLGMHERNYHVFYQLVRGLQVTSSELSMSLCLNAPVEAFDLLIQGNCSIIRSASDDVENYQSTVKALECIHCTDEETRSIWTLLACILHMGNFKVYEDASTESIQISSPTMDLEALTALLGIPAEIFLRGLTSQQMVIMKRASIKIKRLSVLEVRNNILALIKWIYNRLFSWLVIKINHANSKSNSADDGAKKITVSNAYSSFIGILDIFGFEILGVNSFEQLCINFTNERLQQQFNEYVFTTEQDMYRREGLEWSDITFRDNQHVIDLISSTKRPKQGLLILLEEQSMLNRAPDDIALINTFNSIHEPIGVAARASSAYLKSKFGNDMFIIKHFAGEVSYTIDGFLAKNNDALQDDLLSLLKSSDNVFLRNALNIGLIVQNQPGYIPTQHEFSAKDSSNVSSNTSSVSDKKNASSSLSSSSSHSPTKRMASSSSVSQQFRTQLDALLNTLRQTEPHYIKCIKPNASKKQNVFDAMLVIEQLRYSGVLEVVRIRREGYPIRMKFIEFYRSYEIFAKGKPVDLFPGPDKCRDEAQALQCCSLIASWALSSKQYQIGHSMIFLRDDAFDVLRTSIKRFYGAKAIKIQAVYKRIYARRKYLQTLAFVLTCQSMLRMLTCRSKYIRFRQALVRLQELFHGKVLRRRFILIYSDILTAREQLKIVRIQKLFRGFKARLLYAALCHEQLRIEKAVLVQSICRRYMATKILQALRYEQFKQSKAIRIQTIYRQHLAIKKLRQLQYKRWKQRQVVRIQAVYRRYIAKKLVAVLNDERFRHKQAVRIQSCYRKYLARCLLLRLQHDRWRINRVELIQTFYRTYRARQQKNNRRKVISATYLQLIYRKYRVRQKFISLLAQLKTLRLQSAVIIQSMSRMRSSKRYSKMLRAMATKIQLFLSSKFRCYKQRYQYVQVRWSVGLIQSSWRSYRRWKINKCVLLIQTIVRGAFSRREYQRMKSAAIMIQGRIRGYQSRCRFLWTKQQVILLQARVRCFIQQIRFWSDLYKIITTQAIARGRIARKYFLRQLLLRYRSAESIQRICKGYRDRKLFHRSILAIIRIQTFFRLILAQRICFHRYHSLVLMQSMARMFIQRNRYFLKLFVIIKIQSFIRMVNSQFEFIRTLDDVIKLQSWFRMAACLLRYKRIRASSQFIKDRFRYWLYARKTRATRRIQSYLRNTHRILQIHKRFFGLHRILMGLLSSSHQNKQQLSHRIGSIIMKNSRDDEEVIEAKFFQYITQYPYERNRYFEFCTYYHSALIGGNINLMRLLNPTIQSIFECSSKRRNSVHYLALCPSDATLKMIRLLLATYKVDNNNKNVLNCCFDDEDRESFRRSQVDAVGLEMQLKALMDSVKTDKLMEGWLNKKRGSILWQKRYVVLTEDYMIYYQSDNTLNSPKFAIPLKDISIQRQPGTREFVFEVTSPLMNEKKRMFSSSTKKSILFQCASEEILQGWLKPLKSIAGIQVALRPVAPNYINMKVINLWASSTDVDGNTALHVLACYQIPDHPLSPLRCNNALLKELRSRRALLMIQPEEAVKYAAWLIENGCSINAQNREGNTALHLLVACATEHFDKELMHCLVCKGADVDTVRDIDNCTVIDAASKSSNLLLSSYLAELIESKSRLIKQRASYVKAVDPLRGYSYLSIYLSDCILRNHRLVQPSTDDDDGL